MAVVAVVGVLEEWQEVCMHYRISVALVLILSQEASKQLALSVVTGDDPTCVSLRFQCEQQNWRLPVNQAIVVLCVLVCKHNRWWS